MDEVKRYVNLSFIIACIIMSWFYMKFAAFIMGMFQLADERVMGERVTYSTVAGILLAIVTTVLLWRSPRIYEGSLNVAREMKKVTWPDAEETKYSMKVVIAMSVIVALILFVFDFCSKELTDLILGIN